MTGPFADESRATAQVDLMAPFARHLPDMRATFWMHDTPVMHNAGELKQRLSELARSGEIMPENEVEDWQRDDPAHFVGFETFCPPDSNIRRYMDGTDAGMRASGRSFIANHLQAMDVCRHPENLNLHGFTTGYGLGPRGVALYPLFSHSKMPSLFSDLLITPLEQYGWFSTRDPDWSDKKHNKMLWRGSTTGSRYDRGILWRPSQRTRLVKRASRRAIRSRDSHERSERHSQHPGVAAHELERSRL